MIRKLIKFLKKCWGKKAAYAYAGLMLTACILTYKLYFASGSNIFKSEEEKASVASSVAEGKIAYGEKNIIQGDITDRMVMHIIKMRKLIPRPSALRLKMPAIFWEKRVRHGYMMRFRVQIKDVRFRQHWIRIFRNIVTAS